MAKDLIKFYREIFLIITNLSVTGYHFTSAIINFLYLIKFLQVFLNPVLPTLPWVLGMTPIGIMYPDAISLPEDIIRKTYLDQMYYCVMERAPREELQNLMFLSALLLGLGWVGGLFKRLLPSAVDDDYAHLGGGGGLGWGWRGWVRFMYVGTKVVFALLVAPQILSNYKHTSSFLVLYLFLVYTLTAISLLTESVYSCYTSYDSIFISPTVLNMKVFTDLFLRTFASYQEAIVAVMALFTPAPAYHYVTPLKMFVSCVVLFYYLPSPFLLFSDGWEEREEIGRIWGALTDEKRMEIEEMMIRADPAFKEHERKVRRAMGGGNANIRIERGKKED